MTEYAIILVLCGIALIPFVMAFKDAFVRMINDKPREAQQESLQATNEYYNNQYKNNRDQYRGFQNGTSNRVMPQPFELPARTPEFWKLDFDPEQDGVVNDSDYTHAEYPRNN